MTMDISRRMDAVFAQREKLRDSNGMALIAKNGSVAYEKTVRYADPARRMPFDRDTIFLIASITKQFTAACALLLVQAGRVALDAPMGVYLPEYCQATGITVRQLLNQASGVPEAWSAPGYSAVDGNDQRQIYAFIQGLAHERMQAMWRRRCARARGLLHERQIGSLQSAALLAMIGIWHA